MVYCIYFMIDTIIVFKKLYCCALFYLIRTGKLLFIYNLVHIGYKEDELSVESEISIYELYSSSCNYFMYYFGFFFNKKDALVKPNGNIR